MAGDSDKPEQGSLSVLAICLFAAGVFLPAYVLSIGPFVWLVDHGYAPRIVGIIYWPIALIADQIPYLRPVLMRYLELWQ